MDGVHRSPRRHRFNRRRQRRRSGVDTAASSQSDGMDSYVKTSSTADFLEHLLKYRRRPAKTSDPGTLFFFALLITAVPSCTMLISMRLFLFSFATLIGSGGWVFSRNYGANHGNRNSAICGATVKLRTANEFPGKNIDFAIAWPVQSRFSGLTCFYTQRNLL